MRCDAGVYVFELQDELIQLLYNAGLACSAATQLPRPLSPTQCWRHLYSSTLTAFLIPGTEHCKVLVHMCIRL